MTATTEIFPSWIDGKRHDGKPALSPLVSPNDESVAGQMVESDAAIIDAAVTSAHRAFLAHQHSTLATRIGWLNEAAEAVAAAEERIIASLIRFIGKPRRAATFEAKRSAQFLRTAAQQLPHLSGELLPLDQTPLGADRIGFTARIPYGVVAAITPFNAPANLLVQKLAPALAMGNTVVAKPSPPGTATALIVAEALQQAKLPHGLFNVLTGGREAARALCAHPLVQVISLTGSTAAGNDIARAAGAKKFLAELGSNAANIVCADADLADAAQRIAGAAFEASGQQCISAQRIIVEAPVFDQFLELFTAAARKLKVGPAESEVDVGPMIGREAADRVEQMIKDTVAKGAKLVLAPTRTGCILSPAILAEAASDSRLMCEEAFGPVVTVQKVANLDAALDLANSSEFGLQGACFTRSLDTAFTVSRRLRVGSLWINEASRFRLDTYPFGGVGSSGFGREGVRYAMEEMSQWKFTGIRLSPTAAK